MSKSMRADTIDTIIIIAYIIDIIGYTIHITGYITTTITEHTIHIIEYITVITSCAATAVIAQTTIVHKQKSVTHTEHHEGPAPVQVTVQHNRTVNHHVVHHRVTRHPAHTSSVKHEESKSSSTTTVDMQH